MQPPTQWVQGLKQLGHEGDNQPPSSTEVKNVWSYTSTPPYSFVCACGQLYHLPLQNMF
jgi:hypothetical protein